MYALQLKHICLALLLVSKAKAKTNILTKDNNKKNKIKIKPTRKMVILSLNRKLYHPKTNELSERLKKSKLKTQFEVIVM